jgi:hypothetical protein
VFLVSSWVIEFLWWQGEFIVPKNFDDPLSEDILQDFENPN